MKKLSLLLFVFGFWGLFWTQTQMSGIIKNEDGEGISNVLIINMKTYQKTQSDAEGNFQISAQVSDEIRLVKKGYDRITHSVKDFDFQGNILFKMRLTESVIPEVEIITKSKINQLQRDIGVPNVKKGTPARPKPAEWKSFLGSVLTLSPNLNALQELVNGDARRKKNLYKYEDLQVMTNEVKQNIGEEYLEEKGIPKERIMEFLTFAIIEKPELKKYVRANNKFQIIAVLENVIPIYIKRLNQEG